MTFAKQLILVKPVIDFPGLERILEATGGAPVRNNSGYKVDTPEIQLDLTREVFQKKDFLKLHFKEQNITFSYSFTPMATFLPFLGCNYFRADGIQETMDPSGFSPYYEQFTNGSVLLDKAAKKYNLERFYPLGMPE